jgi:hypothetical protein
MIMVCGEAKLRQIRHSGVKRLRMQPASRSGNERGECSQGLKTAKAGRTPAPPGDNTVCGFYGYVTFVGFTCQKGRAPADMSIFQCLMTPVGEPNRRENRLDNASPSSWLEKAASRWTGAERKNLKRIGSGNSLGLSSMCTCIPTPD